MRQFVRFALVGLSNTAVSYVAYLALLRAGAPYLAAAACAFVAGAANGYALNRRWTFAARDSRRARLVYVAVQAVALGATTAVVWSLAHDGVPHPAAYVVAVPPVTVASFLANRAWTFRSCCSK